MVHKPAVQSIKIAPAKVSRHKVTGKAQELLFGGAKGKDKMRELLGLNYSEFKEVIREYVSNFSHHLIVAGGVPIQ